MDLKLKNILKGKVVIVGIGNRLRQDDALGSLLVDDLKGKVRAVCFDVGTAPENFLGKIAKENPNTILIVDVVHLDKGAGEYEILGREDIKRSGFTTHDISIHMLIEYLEKETESGIYMLGIQPESTSFGEDLSSKIEETRGELTKLIKEALNA